MTLVRFEALSAVVEAGSLTAAAKQLNVTQSSISHSIASLEREFGFPLLTRAKTGVSLTTNGERMLEHMRAILLQKEKMDQEAAAINGLETGSVKVGTFTSVTMQWLPFILKKFQGAHPGIAVHLVEGDYSTLEKQVLSGQLDCAFLTPPTSDTLQFTPLKKDRMLCIVSNEHRFQHQQVISLQQIKEEPLIMPERNWANEIEAIFKKHDIEPNVKYEISDDQAILAMIQSNLGIGIRPEMTLHSVPPSVSVLELKEECFRIIGLAVKPEMSPATKTFLKHVQKWLARR